MTAGDAPPGADPPAAPPPPAEREAVVRRLTTHFARDHLEMAELERRLDLVYRARTAADLEALEEDLPALEPSAEPGPGEAVPIEPGREVDDWKLAFAVMGGVSRKPGPVAPRRITALALMGGVELDFREVAFGEPAVEVFAFALMGGVEIIVPPGVRVETRGTALMGGFEDGTAGPEPGPGAPVVRVSGFAMMGGVDVNRRRPGESARDARKRLKAERARRRIRSG